MDIGVVLQCTPPAARVIDLARRAETYGFSYVWTFDSHILWEEPYVIYSKILDETRKVIVGPMVTNPATRDWTVTASLFATLNDMYGNRTVCGIGRGDSAVRVLNGKPTTLATLRESIHVIRELANCRSVELNGSTIRFPWARHSRLEVWIAAYGPMALKAAGEAGDGFIPATKIRLILVGLRAVALVALYSVGRLTVAAFGLSSLALSAALGLTLLLRVGDRHQFRYLPGRMYARHLKSNVAYSLGISAFSFQNDGDKTVLAANKFVVDTGLYAAAYRMAQMGMLPMSSVVNATHQRFLHHEEGVKGQHLKRAISFSMVTAAYGALFIVGVMVFAPVLPLIIGEDFKGSVTMLRWLSPLVLLRTLSIFPVNGLMGLGKTMLRTVLIIINAVLSMGLYILLIPKYSWKGGVAGTLIGETVLVGSMWTALVIMQRRADHEVDLAAAEQPDAAEAELDAFDLPDAIIGGSAVPGSVMTDDDADSPQHSPEAAE